MCVCVCVTHWVHLGPSTLGLQRHLPFLSPHDWPADPPMSHWQPGSAHTHRHTHTMVIANNRLLTHTYTVSSSLLHVLTLTTEVVVVLQVVVSIFTHRAGATTGIGFTVALAVTLPTQEHTVSPPSLSPEIEKIVANP